MTQAIPISQIVTVNPAVVGAGGNPLSLNAIMLTTDNTVPTSSLLSFSTADEVSDYFGSDSQEAGLADNYFLGFDNSTKKPGALFFARYAVADGGVPAWLRGSSLAGMTLEELQGVSGDLNITINGAVKFGSVNLSAASSFTDAASLIETALVLSGVASVEWDAETSRFVVTSDVNGAASSMSMASGPAAAGLGLDSGVLSQGADDDTPASAMDRIKDQGQNWATFMTAFEPDIDDKEGFAQWCNSQGARYAYVCWDSAAGYATPSNPAVFGSIVDALNYEGTVVVYDSPAIAAFVCGYAGSIDWAAFNGRATAAFKSQGGLATSVDTLPLATAVLSNNASYYGRYQAPGPGNAYSILFDGRMKGSKFRYLDTYLNQIYLNAQLRLALFVGLTQVNSAPYNSQGYTLIRAWCADPIAEALNNGSIRTDVPLDQQQKANIASQAGIDISVQLQTQGYYLQIVPATAQTRQDRQSPPIKLWYMDGGAIQQIAITSNAVL